MLTQGEYSYMAVLYVSTIKPKLTQMERAKRALANGASGASTLVRSERSERGGWHHAFE